MVNAISAADTEIRGKKMSGEERLTEQQFAAAKDAMMNSEFGRSFLEEFGRRASIVSAKNIETALNDIRRAVGGQPATSHVEILRRELQEMSASIMQTRREIAAIKPEDTGNNRIMAATGELDAIVTATERATNEILAAAENIQGIVEKLREGGADEASCDSIEEHATEIFMACSFQDITGQRTTKVVSVLHYLEHRVNTMIEIWGVDGVLPAEPTGELVDERPDAHLLSGPQAEGEGVEQDEIDRLLNEMMDSGGDAGDESGADAPIEEEPLQASNG